jgi:hypothetical protein
MYQTPQGIVTGESHGKSNGAPVEVRARDGYAVGALTVRGGGGLDAVTVTFMKIVGTGLDPTQTYTSEHIGGSGGGETIIDGGGIPIVGITGKIDSNEHAAGLGVVFVSTPSDAAESNTHRRSRSMKLTPVP